MADQEEMDVVGGVDRAEDQMDHGSRQPSVLISPHLPPLRNTSVIVSVTPEGREGEGGPSSEMEHSRSGNISPSFSHPANLLKQRHLHSDVRRTISEPLKAKLQRPGSKHQRLSPVPKRSDLEKTLSVGAGLDMAVAGWHSPGENSLPQSPAAMDSAHSSNDSLGTMSSEGRGSAAQDVSPHTPITKMQSTPLQTSQAWLAALSSASATPSSSPALPASQEQLEQLQKQMYAYLEQQKHLLQASAGKPEMIPFPITVWPLGNSPLIAMSTNASSSVSPSPTPSLASTDSGVSLDAASALRLGVAAAEHRPLSHSQSAPGLQQPMSSAQYENLIRQFQLQHQHLLLQQQQLYQHFLDQQQRLVQQAVLEKKHFEDQQRQLATMHLSQQQQLQKQQQLLRQMQEQQLMQLQRQQQMLFMQSLGIQRQHQVAMAAKKKAGVQRTSKPEAISLPFTGGMSTSLVGAGTTGGDADMMDTAAGQAQSHSAANLSPGVLHRALSATNSSDSVGSTNGRSSPSVVVSPQALSQERQVEGGTGLVYDSMMLKHNCCCGSSHPEHPGRLQSIWARLQETGIVQKCTRLRARKASLAELQSLHSENHSKLYGRPSQRRPGQERRDPPRAFVQLPCGGVGVDSDTYWNDQHTSNASRMAVGSVIELADKIISGEIRNGLALVRPPGHHAMQNQAMAFCYFNNVALAAKSVISKNRKVAIVDWDIHHGNGTQQIFYDNPNVLFISLHRFDSGTFFPGTGRPEEIGSGAGLGFNVNLAFSGKSNFQGTAASNFGDPEYLAAFRAIVIPILRDYEPDIILVSAGFNATNGHPPTLGGYSLTPKCYAHMTRMLMNCGNGRVALALEGGYELMSLCESAESCMRSLLGEQLAPLESASVTRTPQAPAIASLEKTINYHKSYWPSLAQSAHLLNMSQLEAERCDETIAALACLSMGGVTRSPSSSS